MNDLNRLNDLYLFYNGPVPRDCCTSSTRSGHMALLGQYLHMVRMRRRYAVQGCDFVVLADMRRIIHDLYRALKLGQHVVRA